MTDMTDDAATIIPAPCAVVYVNVSHRAPASPTTWLQRVILAAARVPRR